MYFVNFMVKPPLIINTAMITFQGCIILCQSIINSRAGFWWEAFKFTKGLRGSCFLSHQYLKQHDSSTAALCCFKAGQNTCLLYLDPLQWSNMYNKGNLRASSQFPTEMNGLHWDTWFLGSKFLFISSYCVERLLYIITEWLGLLFFLNIYLHVLRAIGLNYF